MAQLTEKTAAFDQKHARKLAAVILPLALAFGAATHAKSADVGECGTPEAMSANMKAEGQHSIAHADMVNRDGKIQGMMFTSNADLSVGYI